MRAALLVFLIATACKGKPAPVQVPGGFDERQVCTVDADCVVVEIECCDHCNGGTPVGVHRDHAKDVEREYRSGRCMGVHCTLMACTTPEPICRQERCGVSIGGTEQMTPLPRP